MSDLESVISGAVQAAEASGSVPADTTPAVSDDTPQEAAQVESAPEGADGTEIAQAEAPAAPPTELTAAEMAAPSIPVPRHKAILENARKDYETKLAAVQKQYDWVTPDTRETVQAFQLAETNKPLFAKVILQDPEYQEIFRQMFSGAQSQQPAQPQAAAPQRIEPDFQSEDGKGFYSADALQKLLQQQRAEMEQMFDSRLSERFKDVEPIVRDRREQAMLEHLANENRPYVESLRERPGFKEHEAEIKEKFSKNLFKKNYTLETAYHEVVFPKFQADRDKMRQEILAEMNKKPAAVVKPGQTSAVPTKSDSLEDVIRNAVAQHRG